MPRNPQQDEPGAYFQPEVRNANRLSLAFTKAVAASAEDINDNVVVSPYNAMTFLTMAALGTKGATRKEYADILFGAAPTQLKAQAQKFASLNSSILKSNDGKVTLKTANALWVNSNTGKLDTTYKSELEGIFGAEVSDRDFDDENVVTEMNKWGSDATGGLIPKFIDSLESDDRSILAGAIYFKGDWTRKFDRKNTKDRDFLLDGQSEPVQMPTMHQEFKEGEVTYHHGDNYDAIALTFGEKNYEKQPFKTPSMRIVLIRPDDPSLTARDWLLAQDEKVTPAWVDPASFRSALGTVELPHMEIKQKHKLIPALEGMGFKNAFTSAANYSGMGKGGVRPTEITQDVVFLADEDGATAAAITHGRFKTTAIRTPPPRIDIKFDRSFIFALQDIESNAILFTGVVNKPNTNMKAAPKPEGPT